jgi:hypothetical protein
MGMRTFHQLKYTTAFSLIQFDMSLTQAASFCELPISG